MLSCFSAPATRVEKDASLKYGHTSAKPSGVAAVLNRFLRYASALKQKDRPCSSLPDLHRAIRESCKKNLPANNLHIIEYEFAQTEY